MDRPPRRKLDYFFLRSSFDPSDTDNLQNVVDHTVYTPASCRFGSNLHLELVVNRDGTARPKFIYKTGVSVGDRIEAIGNPFYMDMTYTQPAKGSTTYIGLDFGSSNTSVSFVDKTSVHVFHRRASEKSWSDLSDLRLTLPYPLAEPLSRYLGEIEAPGLAKRALEFLEASMAVGAYVVFLEYCSTGASIETKLFKSYRQRSIGPLWGFLKEGLRLMGGEGTISSPYRKLLEPQLFELIEKFVGCINDFKHDKLDAAEVHSLRPVQILANVSNEVFTQNIFGYFENVRKQRFGSEYEGIFRCAHGNPRSQKFMNMPDRWIFLPNSLFWLILRQDRVYRSYH